ncbi:phosphate/phosphite/phosphonate ABC transporter substrate-binding protein [Iningainema tapete]|uniref:Phosphate/phosphite/phosphonate ABC transporter substrate-binding protein n=1 Tax=Iningainema tapete BLCC-T55 TaxID=2748662 RepID=A0A8J7CFZ8_9CYAN|nr:phosphate/phosphite/phosphonate ABC transporter substrate-binding protein [Iningainema tapete]MBD2775650.1 phosphate/phosphite/phosphonate ABC transporter substrate-binding protein [Iningainema tapete BLCC-T55]
MKKCYGLFSKVAVVVALLLCGCVGGFGERHFANTDEVTKGTQSPQLKIGVLPTQTKTEQKRMIKPLDDYLEKVLGRRVDFLIAEDYKQVVDWMIEQKVDMAYVEAVSYIEARERGAEFEPLVAPIDKYTGRPWYRAAIIVKADSSIKNLTDLKGKRIAFVNKSSTSGYLMQIAALKENVIELSDFAQVIFPGTHAKTEATLFEGFVDAVATNIPSYIKRQKIGRLTSVNSRVLWQSAPVPHSPILVSQKLPPETIKDLKRAFLQVPEGIEDIVGTELAGYTLVEDADYEPIRQLPINMKNSEGAK